MLSNLKKKNKYIKIRINSKSYDMNLVYIFLFPKIKIHYKNRLVKYIKNSKYRKCYK